MWSKVYNLTLHLNAKEITLSYFNDFGLDVLSPRQDLATWLNIKDFHNIILYKKNSSTITFFNFYEKYLYNL